MHLNEQDHRRDKICKTNSKYRITVCKFLTRLQTSNSEENLSQRKTSGKEEGRNQPRKGPIDVFLLVKNNNRRAFSNLTYQFNE